MLAHHLQSLEPLCRPLWMDGSCSTGFPTDEFLRVPAAASPPLPSPPRGSQAGWPPWSSSQGSQGLGVKACACRGHVCGVNLLIYWRVCNRRSSELCQVRTRIRLASPHSGHAGGPSSPFCHPKLVWLPTLPHSPRSDPSPHLTPVKGK